MATEKPKKTRYLPLDFLGSGKLPLPSFGTSVTKSNPKVGTIPADKRLFGPSHSGDAFSVSYAREGSDLPPTDQDFLPLDRGYVRRILLEIFSNEEYEKILTFHKRGIRRSSARYKPSLNNRHNNPGEVNFRTASVRLSDLRLANDIGTTDLKAVLKVTIGGLETPLTTERVLRWKWEALEVPHPAARRTLDSFWVRTEEGLQVERRRLIAVSFAAAALCLLLDLNARSIPRANRDDLREWVVKLRDVIEKFAASLDRTATVLEKLVAARSGGRPKEGIKDYWALHLYRMGRDYKEIAGLIGIKPYNEETGDGSRSWLTKVKQHVAHGIEVEREKLPQAADVFARRNEGVVRRKAIEAYRNYIEERSWFGVGYHAPVDLSDNPPAAILGDPADETHRAYVQLGACLELGVDPLLSTNPHR